MADSRLLDFNVAYGKIGEIGGPESLSFLYSDTQTRRWLADAAFFTAEQFANTERLEAEIALYRSKTEALRQRIANEDKKKRLLLQAMEKNMAGIPDGWYVTVDYRGRDYEAVVCERTEEHVRIQYKDGSTETIVLNDIHERIRMASPQPISA